MIISSIVRFFKEGAGAGGVTTLAEAVLGTVAWGAGWLVRVGFWGPVVAVVVPEEATSGAAFAPNRLPVVFEPVLGASVLATAGLLPNENPPDGGGGPAGVVVLPPKAKVGALAADGAGVLVAAVALFVDAEMGCVAEVDGTVLKVKVGGLESVVEVTVVAGFEACCADGAAGFVSVDPNENLGASVVEDS